jgi:ABC-type Mn2+/Zn2+ transport system ATPase subunit
VTQAGTSRPDASRTPGGGDAGGTADGGELLVRSRALALAYDAEPVLHDVDLDIRAGEFWFFLGRNGSGKTTFLRAFLGLLEPRHGELWFAPSLRGRRGVGFVPQLCEINPALPTTVREFVSLGLVGIDTPHAEREQRLRDALARVGLAERERHSYWALSGGQRQRALVARALIRAPRLLILDEPMNHLDPDAEEALLGDLLALHRERGMTLLFVTHDVGMAERHATHLATFAAGTVTIAPGRVRPLADAVGGRR